MAMNSFAATETSPGVGTAPWLVAGAAVLAVAAGIKYARAKDIDPRLLEASLLPYCHDIVEAMGEQTYAVVGGVAIDGFNHEDTVIDATGRRFTLKDSFDTPLLRATNHTVRDYDIFTLNRGNDHRLAALSKPDQVAKKQSIQAQAARRAQAHAQPAPKISVFSFDETSSLFHTATMVDDEGRVTLRQGFTEQLLPETVMETWEMVLPDGLSVSVLNPWEQYWRSMVRFSSGMKTKDGVKLNSMLHRLRDTPGLAELEYSDLCKTYETFYQEMLAGNSLAALTEEINTTARDWRRIGKVSILAAARKVLSVGEKNKLASFVVQRAPEFFDRFVGGS